MKAFKDSYDSIKNGLPGFSLYSIVMSAKSRTRTIKI